MARFTRAQAIAQAPLTPLIPVFYHAEAPYAKRILQACYAGGVRMFEFTNRGPRAFDVFSELQAYVEADYPDLLLGAGTIFTAAEAEQFIAAGADFIVQPVISADVAAVCQRHDLAWLPGAMTLNEVYQATQLGAALVKIFPASFVGPGYITTLRGPLPHVPFMVTGGIEPTPAALAEWFRAGATCVGIGSRLLKSDDPAALTAHVAKLLRGIQALRP
ncbi:bifunctional 4-hydroxy-2-oxoglutarate aldolase/2-dehydro-3-deoxy-phosphogluconate aldolase [Hymenobacter fastidiosus]|uniref:Bifunctional 4-hydroxy-2-oxoglutarate aldolase/2-dehydro-3-deoxy-phosphogluconate aldolase n=1 Tax=Hymenobacter fastidiosus TaxID=486264 RepID=A0ABP7SJJ8_9BACT